MSRTKAKPAETASGRELLRQLRLRTPEMIAAIRQIVELESPSFSKPAVDRLGTWLGTEFERLGARVRFHRAQQYGDHLQADFAGQASDRGRVLLLGHFDTVWDVGTLATMPFRQEKGRLWGPGVLDMKAGIAQMMFAVDGLRRLRGILPRPVTVLLVTDEEVHSDSSRPVTEALARQSAAVLVLEPAFGRRGALKTARKGVGDYTVKVFGRAAHSGLEIQKGHSAIVELARQITRIARFGDRRRGITVNPGVVQGGTRSNVVAAEASTVVDVRVARMGDAARLEKRFRSLKPFDPGCRLEISGGVNRPPLERSDKVVALYRLAQKAAREMGWNPQEASVGGGSDGNFTAALGIPTLDGLGAVGEGAHALHESVVISELPRRTALLARLIETI